MVLRKKFLSFNKAHAIMWCVRACVRACVCGGQQEASKNIIAHKKCTESNQIAVLVFTFDVLSACNNSCCFRGRDEPCVRMHV